MKISLNFPQDRRMIARIEIEFEEGDHPMRMNAVADDYLDGMTSMGAMVYRGMQYL